MSQLSPARTALVAAAVINVALCIAALAVEGAVPSAFVFPVVLAVGVWRLSRSRDRGGVYFFVAGAVFLLIHIPFLREALSDTCAHPLDETRSCSASFWLAWLAAGPMLLMITAVVSWFGDRRAAVAPGSR